MKNNGRHARQSASVESLVIRYALIGAAVGLLFPLLATAVVLWSSGKPFTPAAIIRAQVAEPLLWIADGMVLLLVILGALAGQREARQRRLEARLRHLVRSLQERLGQRARDLDRAVVVSHAVARVTDLDEMLTEAAEQLRASFDLYEVHIYLDDPAGRQLVRRGGAGSAGSSPALRRQRFPYGPGSIIGTAAVERQTIVMANAAADHWFHPSSGAADSWSELAVPLLLGERVVGVLDLQSDTPGALTAEDLPALEAIASQLAIAIEHARLVAEATQARADMEAQARRLAEGGWQEFFNAIDRREQLRYAYGDGGDPGHREQAGEGPVLDVPILVTGQNVGAISLEGGEGQGWSAEDAELVAAVARQVGQQVENLRLLAEAERYREEAESATRRLTREGWETYLRAHQAHPVGFVYDADQVRALDSVPAAPAGPAHLSRPLQVRGEHVGRLEVSGSSPAAETDELVAAVAEQLSSHLENLRLTEQTEQALAETEEQARKLATLNEMSQALAAASTVDEVYRIVAEMTWRLVLADRTSVAVIHEAEETFEILALEGDRPPAQVAESVALEGSSVGVAVAENRVVVVNQTAESGMPGIQSFMVAPLRAGGHTFGTLNVGSHQANAYDTQDARLLLQVASLLAPTLESRRLFSETEKRAEELALINQTARAVSRQLEMDQLLETIYRQIQRVLQADAFHIGLYNPDTHEMAYPILYEAGRRVRQASRPLHPDSFAHQVIQSGEPVLRNLAPAEVEKTRVEEPDKLIGSARSIVTASLIFVPLQSGAQVRGVMSIQSYRYNAYRPSDVALLSGIASYVAVALDNARLFEEARLRAEELAILNDMGRALTSIVSLDAVIENVYKNTARMMDAASFYIALYEPQNDMIDVRLFGEGEEGPPEELRRQSGRGVTEHIIRTREPLLIREGVKEQLEALGIALHGREAQSWLGVPMITGDQVIGVIAVQNFDRPRAYDEHDRELLTAVASQAAIAIENARLFAQVQARARREQILREVTARVRGTPDVDTVMRTAAKEIGRALGRQAFVVLGEGESSPEAEPPEESSNGQ